MTYLYLTSFETYIAFTRRIYLQKKYNDFDTHLNLDPSMLELSFFALPLHFGFKMIHLEPKQIYLYILSLF